MFFVIALILELDLLEKNLFKFTFMVRIMDKQWIHKNLHSEIIQEMYKTCFCLMDISQDIIGHLMFLFQWF